MEPRITVQVLKVLNALLEEPGGDHFGWAICRKTGLPSGTVYPILLRLERAGWIVSQWQEDYEPEKEGRPRRRYYRLSAVGAARARAALSEARAGLMPPDDRASGWLRPGEAPT
jgi:PadR family transcriptional regulator, regulatory protein PadR